MTVVDYVILIVLLLSALISLVRGFVREVLSLLSWGAAVWLAIHFTSDAMVFMEPYIESVPIRKGASFIGIFLVVLISLTILSFFIGKLVRSTGLGGTDRFLGILFGFARGAIAVVAFVFFSGVTTFPEQNWWQESRMLGQFERVAGWLQDELPPEISDVRSGFASR